MNQEHLIDKYRCCHSVSLELPRSMNRIWRCSIDCTEKYSHFILLFSFFLKLLQLEVEFYEILEGFSLELWIYLLRALQEPILQSVLKMNWCNEWTMSSSLQIQIYVAQWKSKILSLSAPWTNPSLEVLHLLNYRSLKQVRLEKSISFSCPLASGVFWNTSKMAIIGCKNTGLFSVKLGVLSFAGKIGEVEWRSTKHSNLINTKHLWTQT